MIKQQKNIIIQTGIVLIGALLFIPFLGNVHLFDWDEINFAESAREMLLTHDYLTVKINFLPFWEKPPLFIWIQAVSMHIFSINAFAARLPNALVGIITLLVLYNIGRKLYDYKFGLLWTLVYAGSILPQFYFKSGIIDPLFNLFIFLGIYHFFLWDERNKLIYIVSSAVFIGLGILTKGPVALLIFLLTVFIYMVITRSYSSYLNWKVILLYLIVVSLTGGFWFILQILSGHGHLIMEFINYQIRLFSQEDAGHGGFLFYHFVVLFFGVFPASIFSLKGFLKYKDDQKIQTDFRHWMIILFWVVLILFTIVKTKIVHYSSLCYFPITFLAAYIIIRIIEKKQIFNNWIKITLCIVSFLLGMVVMALTFIELYKNKLIASGLIKDHFAIGNLQANVHWSGFEFFIPLILMLGVTGSVIFFKNNRQKIIGIFVSTLLFTNISMIAIVPKVEQYSQNAAITFFSSLADKDCYVDTYGYKSYAVYFYTKKKEPQNKKSYNKDWLLKGDIDKPVYIICKNTTAVAFSKRYSWFKKIGEKNGFVFFLRKAKTDAPPTVVFKNR